MRTDECSGVFGFGQFKGKPHRCLQRLHLLAQAGDLVLDASGPGFGDVALVSVGPVQRRQIARTMLASTCSIRLATLAMVVHSFEPAAINRDNGSSEQTQLPA
jgi:hypothetical protein